MISIVPGEVSTHDLHAFMLASVAPRPICFASTMDKNGNPNLSPFSFFNAFGSNPPIVVFSPARRVRDNTIKHTLENIYETKEVVINAVNYSMVRQSSLASSDYPKGVNEFEKAKLTPIPSHLIKPFRVKESPVQSIFDATFASFVELEIADIGNQHFLSATGFGKLRDQIPDGSCSGYDHIFTLQSFGTAC